MQISERVGYLLEIAPYLIHIERILISDVLEQISSSQILQHNIESIVVNELPIKLYDVLMGNTLVNFDFFFEVLNNVAPDVRQIDLFEGVFFEGSFFYRQINLRECPMANFFHYLKISVTELASCLTL